MTRPARLAVLIVALALPAAPRAHGVSQEIDRRGRAVAVRALYQGGGPLAGATYQVLGPGEPPRVLATGRTDAQGWVEFVPDVAGRWCVRIVDATGHGRVVTVDVPSVVPAEPLARPAASR